MGGAHVSRGNCGRHSRKFLLQMAHMNPSKEPQKKA